MVSDLPVDSVSLNDGRGSASRHDSAFLDAYSDINEATTQCFAAAPADKDDDLPALDAREQDLVNRFRNMTRDAAAGQLAQYLQAQINRNPRMDPVQVIQQVLDRLNPHLQNNPQLYFHVGTDQAGNIGIGGPLSGGRDVIVVRARRRP